MKAYRNGGVINKVSQIISYLLIVMLILGIVGVCAYFLVRPKGIYLRYGDKIVTEKTGGIVIPQAEEITLTIKNDNGFGTYSVTDCVVTIVPNVDKAHDFSFTVEGNEKPLAYSAIKDLTSAFTSDYNGKSIKISPDGTFKLKISVKSVSDLLKIVYPDKNITTETDEFLSKYPYVALKIVSPDGSQTLTIPLKVGVMVDDVQISPNEVIF